MSTVGVDRRINLLFPTCVGSLIVFLSHSVEVNRNILMSVCVDGQTDNVLFVVLF